MTPGTLRYFFDFVDPLSYLVDVELEAAEAERGVEVERVPLELRPPPAPIRLSTDEPWRERWALAAELADEPGRAPTAPRLSLEPPALVPWSRKAHELFLHARSEGAGPAARAAIFRAFFGDRADIGRVDVLVEIARSIGLDHTHAKAVLDVDRHRADVLAARRLAEEARVGTSPTLVLSAGRLEGFHNRAALSTFLALS